MKIRQSTSKYQICTIITSEKKIFFGPPILFEKNSLQYLLNIIVMIYKKKLNQNDNIFFPKQHFI